MMVQKDRDIEKKVLSHTATKYIEYNILTYH